MASSDTLLEVFTALRGRLTRLVVGIVPPRDVEDIVQETYVRVCQVENKDAIRQPQSYMFRTARNLALNQIKRHELRFTDGVDDIDELGGPFQGPLDDQTYEQVASDEQFALFCEAVRHLPQQCRRAYVLKKVYGYSLREIAHEMNLSEHTVENHIVAGAKKCMRYRRKIRGTGSDGGRATQLSRPPKASARPGGPNE